LRTTASNRRFAQSAAALVAVLAAGVVASAQSALPAVGGHPDFSGYWELRFDSMNVPKALLTADAAARSEARAHKDVEAIRDCTNVGMPALMNDRAPIDIRHSPSRIAIIARSPSSARYIYLDDRGHPQKDELEETTNGHSVGRWQGDGLIVDTIGLNDRGVTSIPGGGARTPRSHLTERFRLVDADRLSVTFTWEDATVFQKPHTYEFWYYRVPAPLEPRVFNCLPNDPARSKFLLEPPAPGK
jgi:hypothetical protein